MALNVVDWVIVGLAVVGGIGGGFAGFFDEVSRKLGFVAGIFTALTFSGILIPVIMNGTGLGRFPSALISYFAIFLVTFILIAAVGGILSKLFEAMSLSFVDRILGFFLGMAEVVLVFSVIWMFLSYQSVLSLGDSFHQSWIVRNLLDKLAIVGRGMIGA